MTNPFQLTATPSFEPLTPAGYQAALADALARYPQEAVGYADANGAYVPLVNIAAEPSVEFALSAADETKLFTEKAQALVHSHTDGQTCPSAIDMQSQAAMALPWLVIVLNKSPDPADKGKPYFIDEFWFGDQVPMPALEGRVFRHGVTDCYALVRDWHKTQSGLVLPHFPRDHHWWTKGKPGNLILDNLQAAGGRVVAFSEVQEGDVFCMALGGQAFNHLGVYVGNGLMLHHMYDRLSVTVPINSWMRHVEGKVFRHG